LTLDECNRDVTPIRKRPSQYLTDSKQGGRRLAANLQSLGASPLQSGFVPLLADAGVPMILITLPGMVLLLIPIIAAEAAFVIRRTSLQIGKVLWATTLANVLSTIVGVPLTWGALFLCEMAVGIGLARFTKVGSSSWNSPISQIVWTVLTAPWLAPDEKSGTWAVPLAALVLLVPFFFVSVWTEQRVMEHFLPVTTGDVAQPNEVNEKVLRRAVRGANLLSYGFMLSFTSVWLVWGVYHR